MRELLAQGIDPLDARHAGRRAMAARLTFGQCAEALLASKASGWRNAKHRDQWAMTLKVYAAPLRPLPVAEVSTQDILQVLQPIWQAKPETASRLRGRIEAVLDAARPTEPQTLSRGPFLPNSRIGLLGIPAEGCPALSAPAPRWSSGRNQRVTLGAIPLLILDGAGGHGSPRLVLPGNIVLPASALRAGAEHLGLSQLFS